MEYPKCPNCPYNHDDGIIVSTIKPGNWYCQRCSGYFPKISGISPPLPELKSLIILETDENLRWSAEEIESALDKPLAQFYAGLNGEDRRDLLCNHVDIDGDFRYDTKD